MSSKYPQLILPKGYLSWSQVSCWIDNRTRYINEYFEDGKRLDTRFLRFGGQFSKMVEELCIVMGKGVERFQAIQEIKGMFPMDEAMESVLMELDIEGISEFQIGNSGREGDNCPVVKVRGIVPILCYLDKYVERTGGIQEYKTSLKPWTMAMVIKHDQLPFYSVGLKWSGKKIPEYADLHWIETKQTQQEQVDFWRDGAKIISATGKIKTFHREFDPREIDRMEDLIVRVAEEISEAYQNFLADI